MSNQGTPNVHPSSELAEIAAPAGSKAVSRTKRRGISWRWFVPRFSLRAILLLMTVVCLILGSGVMRAERQRLACEELERHGWVWSFGQNTFDDLVLSEKEPWWVRWLPEEWRRSHGVHYWCSVVAVHDKGSDEREMLPVVAQLPALHTLSLTYDKYPVDPSIWPLVGRLRTLRRLSLPETTIDDQGLAHLCQLSRLTQLDLSGTLVGDEGVKHLTKLTSLEELNLDDTDVTDRSVGQLTSIPRLVSIDLSNTRVTAGEMLNFPLASHPIRVIANSSLPFTLSEYWEKKSASSSKNGSPRDGREDLRMNLPLGEHVPKLTIDSEIELTPQRLENLSELRNVSDLIMRGSEIGDAQLAHLSELKILRRACFDRTSIGHEGFEWLGRLGTLQQLIVVGSAVTARDIAELGKLEWLKTLTICDCSLDDQTLRAILSLSSVRNLELTRCPLSVNATREFQRCRKRFHRLTLNGTGMSPENFLVHVTPGLFGALTWDGVEIGESVKDFIRKHNSEPHAGLIEEGVIQSRTKSVFRGTNCANVDWGEGWEDGLSLRSKFVHESHLLSAMAIWPQASAVDFTGADVGPATMDALASSRCLERLALARTKVSDHDLRHAARWTSLIHLDLAGCPITDAGVAELESCWRLERLVLDDTSIGDGALKTIARMARLQFLSLRNTNITDAGLRELEGLENLKALFVEGSQVTPEALSDFRFTQRNCTVDLQSRDVDDAPTFRDE